MESHGGLDQLAELAKNMKLEEVRGKYPLCFPERNPMDLYRAHLTNVLHDVTGVDRNVIYPALQWTSGLEKGDLILAAPALRVKGKKPEDLAKEWVGKVRFSLAASS
jgi:arginyl-tRNA synthetase